MKTRDPDPKFGRPEDDAAIEAAAADWHALRDAGLTPPQEQELAAWLGENPRHAEIFAELGETWALLDHASAARPSGAAEPDPDLLAPRRRSRSHRWLPAVGLAAAAAIALAVFSRQSSPEPKGTSGFVRHATTEIGGLETISLPDGSTVRLNTDSTIEVNYSAALRRVRLVRGEAHFAVAKNPARPFVVAAGKIDVQAVGTAFNVRLRSESIEVLVTEGRVKVDDGVNGRSLLPPQAGSSSPLLAAGERVVIPAEESRSATPTAVDPAEIERALAWQDRRLEFAAVPLADVAAEFNRYNRHQLVIDDPQLAARKFGGNFRADGYEALVHLLERDFGVTAERREDKTVLRLAR